MLRKRWINKLIPVLLIIFLFLFSIPCFAENFNVTGSVNENSSQMVILLSTLQNQSDWDPFADWVGLRSGDYDYSIFYNIKPNGNAQRIRYYATSSGYQQTWHFARSSVTNFTYNSNDYTVLGSHYDQLGSSKVAEKQQNTLWSWTVPFILVVLLFFVFRIRKRSSGGVTIR